MPAKDRSAPEADIQPSPIQSLDLAPDLVRSLTVLVAGMHSLVRDTASAGVGRTRAARSDAAGCGMIQSTCAG